MYSRSYYQTDGAIASPPENYDGTAFMEEKDGGQELPYEAPDFIPEVREENPSEKEESIKAAARVSGLPFLSGLSSLLPDGIFGDGGFLQNIGIEEILILAVAAYLIFSGSGDIECAVMLLLLLFIS